MAHVRVLTINTPQQMERVYQDVIRREYYVEGKYFKGYAMPQMAEVKLWDIRIKKQAVPELLRDLNAHNLLDTELFTSNQNTKHHLPHGWLIRPLVKLWLFVTKQYIPQFSWDNSKPFTNKGWTYAFVLGCQNDPEYQKGNEEI
jgi:hypothetical protein